MAPNTDIPRTMRPAQAGSRPDPVELANQLRPVLLHIIRQLRKELHSVGVTAGQVSILVALRDEPGIGIAELASIEGTSAPSISAHIDRLEAAGLVVRQRAAGDRRRIGLRLTADGARVLRAVRSRRTAWLATRLEALADGDLTALDEAIPALARIAARPERR